MTKVRKLQYIGKQHLLNIPAEFVNFSHMQKGDWFAVNQKGNNALEITKVAEKDVPRTDVVLATLQADATGLFNFISAVGSQINPGEFSGRLAQLSHIQAKIRKLKLKMNM
jgi:hypothetical protein